VSMEGDVTKYLTAKWGALAALVSSSFLLHGCQTEAGRPTICASGSQSAQCKVSKKNSAAAHAMHRASARHY